MRIGILGSGLMGAKIGTICAQLGHEVVFSYAHTRAKLERLARTAGGKARAGDPDEAARGADMLLLAVHWSRVDDVLKKAGKLSGKHLITCSLPMSKDDTRLVIGHSSSGAEAVARKVPRAHVVSAFCTVPSEALFPVFEARRKIAPPDLIVCGDHERAKRTTASLIRQMGFHPVDVGDLKSARYVEPFALTVAAIAYSGSINGKLAYRFERFLGRARRR